MHRNSVGIGFLVQRKPGRQLVRQNPSIGSEVNDRLRVKHPPGKHSWKLAGMLMYNANMIWHRRGGKHRWDTGAAHSRQTVMPPDCKIKQVVMRPNPVQSRHSATIGCDTCMRACWNRIQQRLYGDTFGWQPHPACQYISSLSVYKGKKQKNEEYYSSLQE